MATIPETRRAPSLAPNRSERVFGWLALAMLALVVIALAKGHAQWNRLPPLVWVHLATMGVALAITPAILWHPRGTRRHRVLGYLWVGSLAATAILSFGIRLGNPGHFSFVHVISVYVLVMLPIVIMTARSQNIVRHRRAVRGLVIGALLIAGLFTLLPFRLLGGWLFG